MRTVEGLLAMAEDEPRSEIKRSADDMMAELHLEPFFINGHIYSYTYFILKSKKLGFGANRTQGFFSLSLKLVMYLEHSFSRLDWVYSNAVIIICLNECYLFPIVNLGIPY